MNLESIVEARIHPGIGVARVGNSEEYFIGPEVPNPVPPPPGGYRDAQGHLKRQAARFRIFGYDVHGNVVGELTAEYAAVEWTVHVANKKAAWYSFDAALDLPEAATLQSPRRNSQIQGADREQLVIDPGPRTVSGPGATASPFDTGTFFGHKVDLGGIHTDDAGRLIFLGGYGKSGSPLPGYTLTTFANNGGWHDDTSDGPVTATVTIGDRVLTADPAWVVTGPPNYSPDLITPQTMYDVMQDALNGQLVKLPKTPSFTNDILPLLSQFNDAQWVNKGFLAQFGWGAPNDFLDPALLAKLATKPTADAGSTTGAMKGDPYGELRRQIFNSFRNPGAAQFVPQAWPPIYGDAFGSFTPSPRDGFAVTQTLYNYLQQWALGNFEADYNPTATPPQSLDDVDPALRPAALDKAALHFCMGGPFHPGCEMTWPMRQPQMYRAPFRLRQHPDSAGRDGMDYGEFLTQATVTSFDGPLSASGPGDITKWMAVPWQSDTASCRAGYGIPPFPADQFIPTFWPSRVPNNVLTEESYKIVIDASQPMDVRQAAFQYRPFWLRRLRMNDPRIEQITRMIHVFGALAVIERREFDAGPEFPAVMYVATGPHESELLKAGHAGDEGSSVTADFANARFGGLRRH